MPYAVKEWFWSLQGEGANAGRPAVFCRFNFCNLWSGREEDRATATCRFCDTDFVGVRERFPDAASLVAALYSVVPWAGIRDAERVEGVLCVLTGGEPALQADVPLVAALKAAGFLVAIETNGTRPLPPGLDWVTVSPKAGTDLVVTSGDELKLVFPQPGVEPDRYECLDFRRFYLQTMDGLHRQANEQLVARYCMEHPRWSMSFQLHKYLGMR